MKKSIISAVILSTGLIAAGSSLAWGNRSVTWHNYYNGQGEFTQVKHVKRCNARGWCMQRNFVRHRHAGFGWRRWHWHAPHYNWQ